MTQLAGVTGKDREEEGISPLPTQRALFASLAPGHEAICSLFVHSDKHRFYPLVYLVGNFPACCDCAYLRKAAFFY